MKTSIRPIATLLVAAAVCATVYLSGCGGSSGSDTSIPADTGQATVTGQFLGSSFVAVDAANNAIAAKAAGSGSPASFSMPVAIGRNYKFYALQNEGTPFQRVCPVYVQVQGQTQNVFSVAQPQAVDLGFMSTIPGFAMPATAVTAMQAAGMNPVSFDATVPADFAGSMFSDAMLDGTWNMHGMDGSGQWFHQVMTVNSGTATFSDPISSPGSVNRRATMRMAMMPGGVAGSPDAREFNAAMGHNHDMLTGTDLVSQQSQIFMAEKAPANTSFSPADMNGTWQVQGLMSGQSFTGWMQGPVVMDASGNITSSNLRRNDGTPFSLSGLAAVDSTGTATISGSSSFHGSMNQGKDRMIATMTDTASGASVLMVMQKSAAPAHTNADLAGSWYMHNLGVGSAPRSDAGTAHMDASGNGMMQQSSTDAAFSSATPFSFQMQMNGAGMMSNMAGFPGMMSGAMMGGQMPGGGMMPGHGGTPIAGFGGFMSDANDLMVVDMSQTVGGVAQDQVHNMMVYQK